MNKTITKEKMIEAVGKRIREREAFEEKHPSRGYAAWGYSTRIAAARRLLQRLNAGIQPSTQEVVAYFGKGARIAS